ncbi:multidrug efflux RND transporter permease subunit [Altererythrobacter aurantiacus]|mgnify:FL=1|jgi:multidrug efflux pump|uniref:Multidrug efflux RND transporter permease subunit n=1 Tax=Parapontixanthobacter aurantiacus TaxID=1463599 RepID=A0A844ZGP2_9SPHN|nr:multidrug efflux RND transporter permease subunit [Parapontixanthobacter aurantiacus]MXO86316.1 multidrug efflux RND transporter permease subunit [Parapontixanthobacter aurantiacus]QPL40700.1 multidrug efflux RND transporter permease subunit [Erythrobacter sp. A30-3]|tara:strand:+ start:1023 stop:4286 length:3264 start_codon:yes stop_codon:yes gene_type:complete
MARFFIVRPIFAWVVSLAILLAGLLALRALPVEQYPEVAPPSLTINVVYPGAGAETLEQNVTQVIEQQLNGVDGFLYMSSTSTSAGQASITLTFEAGTDIDIAQTEVQNRLSTVEARLPEEVRRQGITVRQASEGFLMIVALTSASGSLDSTDLGNIASNQVIDELRRVNGVGDVMLFGSPYAMRIWLDPEALASYNLSPSAVLAAVREENAQTAGGAIGAQPLAEGQLITANISTEGRFSTVEEFENIILRANTGAAVVRLGEVARVEIGAQSYATSATLNGQPMAGMAIQLATGANALTTAEGIRERLAEIDEGLPPDVAWEIPYDTTPFVEASVEEVVITLVEAMVLVFLVMFLFLQNWRATLIPTLVVPIALAGACLGLWLFGFSINVLSLFGMVLAIGILVDDAIVVIENVERIMREEGLPPLEATRKAMGQITGAIIGITLVLIAVFIPMAFFPGSTGGIYRQFSVTLAIAIFFSAFLALSLTPALCATFLKPMDHEHDDAGEVDVDPEVEAASGWRGMLARAGGFGARFFSRFNRWFARMQEKYGRTNDRILSRPWRGFAVFLTLVLLTVVLFARLPSAMLPTEDQGFLITAVQTQPGATQARTDEALEPITGYWMNREEVENLVLVRGFSFFGRGQNNALMFTTFKPWEERTGPDSSAGEMLADAMDRFMQLDNASAFVIQPPAIQSLGRASGFTLKLQDRGGVGRETLTAARDQMLGIASQSPVIANLRPEDQGPSPEVEVEIDRVQARALGLSLSDVNTALSITFGSAYVNDFNRDGRVLQVQIQADAPYRMTPEDIMALRIPNASGELVPFSAFASARWSAAPASLSRYNGYPAMTLSGTAAPGESSGSALAEMEQLAEQLPQGIGYEWTGLSYEEKQAGGQIGFLLGLSIIVVFLVLAALYESWAVPLAVLLIVPTGVLGAVVFSMLRGLSADIYFNVGLITIVGLAAKNAILIVEFAIEEEERGLRRIDAIKSAARLRLRPIIMTSLAFTMGMVPLALASGAGAASRISVGTGVMGGMIATTIFGIFLIPMLYLLVRRNVSRKQPVAAGHLDEADPGKAKPDDTEPGPDEEPVR